jgi:hypothetical protein
VWSWWSLSKPCRDYVGPIFIYTVEVDFTSDDHIYIYTDWWFGTFFMFHNIWDNPSHWLIFVKMVKTTNQYTYESVWMGSIPWYLMVVCCTPILQQLHLKWWWILEQTEKFHCPDHQLWVFILCITQLNCFGWKVPRFNNGS